ncbi:MAG: hypothetical protein AAFR81_09045 [Chloroflexota bacterium]
MATLRNTQNDFDPSLEAWWTLVHPMAVMIEKYITTEPQEKPDNVIMECHADITKIQAQLESIPITDDSQAMHSYLLRATNYLAHAYAEHDAGRSHESQFYYYNALTELSKLHHQLVVCGLVG